MIIGIIRQMIRLWGLPKAQQVESYHPYMRCVISVQQLRHVQPNLRRTTNTMQKHHRRSLTLVDAFV
jgi:hypothetical protein